MTQHVQQEQSLPFSPRLVSTENEGALRLLQRCVHTYPGVTAHHSDEWRHCRFLTDYYSMKRAMYTGKHI